MLERARSVAAAARDALVAGLRALNTQGIGYSGLGAGAALFAAIGGLFAKLSDPGFLIDVVGEHERHIFGQATATLAGLLFAVLGASIVAVLSCYFGRPFTVSKDAQPQIGTGAPDASAGTAGRK